MGTMQTVPQKSVMSPGPTLLASGVMILSANLGVQMIANVQRTNQSVVQVDSLIGVGVTLTLTARLVTNVATMSALLLSVLVMLTARMESVMLTTLQTIWSVSIVRMEIAFQAVWIQATALTDTSATLIFVLLMKERHC